jgi:predicted esterase
MLDRVFSEVPNVDTSRAFLGGMSNGAHATALLLNGRFDEITALFRGFFLIEGGQFLEPRPRLAHVPFLLMQGELQDKLDLPDLAERLKEVGAGVEFHWMKGVGHSFPEPEHATVRRWIETHLQ